MGALLAAALCWAAPVSATPTAEAAPTACSAHASIAADAIHVAVVIDFGTATSAPGSVPTPPVSLCVVAPAGSNPAAVLRLATQQLGWTDAALQPDYTSEGMLCSIGGYPSSGCGSASGSNFLYWSYWWGEATPPGTAPSWVYANQGLATTRARADRVEGFRFVDGTEDVASLPRPRGSPDATTICRTAAPPTPAPTPAPAPGPVPPAASPGPASPAPTTTTPGADATTVPGAVVAPSTVAGRSRRSARGVAVEEAAPRPLSARRPGSGSGSPVALLVGLGVVGLVVAGGVVRSRRRSA